MKEWLTRKNCKGILLCVLGLMTVLSLLFNVNVLTCPILGDKVIESENGFDLLSFESIFIIDKADWQETIVGVFSLLPLIVGIGVIVVGVVSFFMKDERVAKKWQNGFAILGLVFVGLYMIMGIVFNIVYSEGIYLDSEGGLDEDLFSATTYTYIPFIIMSVLFVAYHVVPSKLFKNDEIVEGVKSTGSVKSQSSKLELLRDYKKALDEGIISQEEFDEKKKELL